MTDVIFVEGAKERRHAEPNGWQGRLTDIGRFNVRCTYRNMREHGLPSYEARWMIIQLIKAGQNSR